jgi:hypothetical protein
MISAARLPAPEKTCTERVDFAPPRSSYGQRRKKLLGVSFEVRSFLEEDLAWL